MGVSCISCFINKSSSSSFHLTSKQPPRLAGTSCNAWNNMVPGTTPRQSTHSKILKQVRWSLRSCMHVCMLRNCMCAFIHVCGYSVCVCLSRQCCCSFTPQQFLAMKIVHATYCTSWQWRGQITMQVLSCFMHSDKAEDTRRKATNMVSGL